MTPSGSYAIGWDQVTLDGVPGADMAACRAGVAWRWNGRALRLDGPPGVLRLGETAEAADLRRRARRGVGRIVPVPAASVSQDAALGRHAITVTDGRRSWQVDLLPARRGARALAHFSDLPPPAGADLWIARVDGSEILRKAEAVQGWYGIAAESLVATPDGPVAVEKISPGMPVLTAAGEVSEVIWTYARAVSAARMCVVPELAPVRVGVGVLGNDLPLLLAPDQRIILEGERVRALYPQGRVTVSACDLVDGVRVTRARGMPGMVAHVVVLPWPWAIMADGVACDGGLPEALRGECPAGVAQIPMGDLRHLSRGEVAILQAGHG